MTKDTATKKNKKELEQAPFRKVIFFDSSSGEKFLLMSSVETESTDTWTDGKEYPMYQVEISSASHPFYTGKEANVEKAGRAEKFRARAAQAKKAPVKKAAAEPADETPIEESTEA